MFKRFIKNPESARMTTVNFAFQERSRLETALANGLSVNQLFFRPTENIEKTGIHVTMCLKCQKEIRPFCTISQIKSKCGKYAENQNTDMSPIGTKIQCPSYLEQHPTASRECRVYLETYQSQLVPLPNQLQDKSEKLITENKQLA